MIDTITICENGSNALIAKASIKIPSIDNPHSKKSALSNLISNKPVSNKSVLNKSVLHNAQKIAVRQLLYYCQTQFYSGYTFFNNTYPYYLDNGNNHYWVSFSHSLHKVALIISPNACGIDVEYSTISSSVAKRFFHPNELAILANHPDPAHARQLLWQIKECFAKLTNTTLSHTISQDYGLFLSTLDLLKKWNTLGQYRLYCDDNICAIITSN